MIANFQYEATPSLEKIKMKMTVEFYFTLMKIYPFQVIANFQYEATPSLEKIEIKMVVEFYLTLMKINLFS